MNETLKELIENFKITQSEDSLREILEDIQDYLNDLETVREEKRQEEEREKYRLWFESLTEEEKTIQREKDRVAYERQEAFLKPFKQAIQETLNTPLRAKSCFDIEIPIY